MEEELIGGFMSEQMGRGTRGYGLYVTTDRIIGVKGTWREMLGDGAGVEARVTFADGRQGRLVATSGPTKGLAFGEKLSRDDTTKALQLLEGKKDFEVRKEELEEVRIQRKKGALKRLFSWWGDLTIKTAKDTHSIRLIKAGPVEMLKEMFTAFCEDKLVVDE